MASGRGEVEIMPQDIVSRPYPLKTCCKKFWTCLAKGCQLLARSSAWLVSLTGLSKEPAMNGTPGFQEVRSPISRSPSYRYRFLHEQQSQFGTGSQHLLRTQQESV